METDLMRLLFLFLQKRGIKRQRPDLPIWQLLRGRGLSVTEGDVLQDQYSPLEEALVPMRSMMQLEHSSMWLKLKYLYISPNSPSWFCKHSALLGPFATLSDLKSIDFLILPLILFTLALLLGLIQINLSNRMRTAVLISYLFLFVLCTSRTHQTSYEELEADLKALEGDGPCLSTPGKCSQEDSSYHHQLDDTLLVHLEGLNKRPHYLDFVAEVSQIQKAFMEQIQSSREKLTKELGLLKQTFEKKQKKMSVKMAFELLERMKKEEEEEDDRAKRSKALLENYRKQVKTLANQLVSTQKLLFEQYSNKLTLDSKIITNDKEGQEHIDFLRANLKQPKKIELLYRGSQNQFRADLFHQKCDNTPDTFTLLRTEFGKVIGGFSHYAWNAVKEGSVHDEGRNAFLLSFDLKQKMVPDSYQCLIFFSPNYGPTFGYGHDLHIADRCDQNNNSYADFPWTYNFEGKYKNGQESWKAFSGADDKYFKVLEYEVFRVRYE